ncbi:hypothetical protein AB0K94_40285, partial [Streptomyces sp. NPDC053794]|uniref:hypothetical protein n=1 Tax=Streptomyces sp. NPDC053794 TaxID=3154760 RepID=UPI003439A838
CLVVFFALYFVVGWSLTFYSVFLVLLLCPAGGTQHGIGLSWVDRVPNVFPGPVLVASIELVRSGLSNTWQKYRT